MVELMNNFRFNEKYLSQIPALRVLIKLGYKYIPPSEAFKYRKGSLSNVLLEKILDEQLRKQNRIFYRKREYPFSNENISTAINKLRRPSLDYVTHANQKIYDLINLPQSLTQTIAGNTRSFDLFYIDWKNWQNNVYHCTSEYTVERSRGIKTARPDIVLFVNGIPLVVIACRPPKEKVDQEISQLLYSQRREYLPYLFAYKQLLLALNKIQSKYAAFKGLEQESIKTLTAHDRDLNMCRPDCLRDLIFRNNENSSYYEMTEDLISLNHENLMVCEEKELYMAEEMHDGLKQHWKVNFWQNIYAQNNVRNKIDRLSF